MFWLKRKKPKKGKRPITVKPLPPIEYDDREKFKAGAPVDTWHRLR